MSGVKPQSKRIVIGREPFRLLIIIVVVLCVPLAMVFAGAALQRPDEPEWWLVTGVFVAFAVYVCWQDVRSTGDWNRYSYLEIKDGSVKFVPSRERRRLGFSDAQASFPEGARFEYERETGDRYFPGDDGQFLQSSLWIVAPRGAKQKLFDSSTAALSPRMMVLNLNQSGISCRAVQIYNGEDGEHTETDITSQYTDSKIRTGSGSLRILLATSSMWLGVVAAILVHNGRYLIGIGVLGFIGSAAIQMRWWPSKRSAMMDLLTTIPSFAGGYAVAVIAVWYILKR